MFFWADVVHFQELIAFIWKLHGGVFKHQTGWLSTIFPPVFFQSAPVGYACVCGIHLSDCSTMTDLAQLFVCFIFFILFNFFTLFSRIYYRADDINALHIIGSTPLSPQDFNLFFNFLKTDCYTRRVAFLLRKRCKKMNSSILGVVLQYRYGKIKSVNSILKVALYY